MKNRGFLPDMQPIIAIKKGYYWSVDGLVRGMNLFVVELDSMSTPLKVFGFSPFDLHGGDPLLLLFQRLPFLEGFVD